MNNIVNFPCSICSKNVEEDHHALQCSFCDSWSHNKCNNIKTKLYKFHQKNEDAPFCCSRCRQQIPFFNMNNDEFETYMKFDIHKDDTQQTNLKLNLTSAQQEVINKLNKLIHETNTSDSDDEDHQQILCNYYSCEEFIQTKFNANKNFSIFHVNIHSIQRHIDELRLLLKTLNYKFDVIAISESKLKDEPTTDINIEGYHSPYCCFTSAEKGGTLLFISNNLNFKPRKDLEIYSDKELESSFIEIINDKESNNIIGIIYRHPKMDPNTFIEDNLDILMDKLSKEKKRFSLLVILILIYSNSRKPTPQTSMIK